MMIRNIVTSVWWNLSWLVIIAVCTAVSVSKGEAAMAALGGYSTGLFVWHLFDALRIHENEQAKK